MKSIPYTIRVHPDYESGGYYATVPALPGVVDQGETVEEVLEKNVRSALAFTVETMLEDCEERPPNEPTKGACLGGYRLLEEGGWWRR